MLLGSAAEFSHNAVKFLQAAHRQYGDVFTIRLVNQYLTIIMDPHSYEAVSREKNFDFDPIQKQVTYCTHRVVYRLMLKLFQYGTVFMVMRDPVVHPTFCRVHMSRRLTEIFQVVWVRYSKG